MNFTWCPVGQHSAEQYIQWLRIVDRGTLCLKFYLLDIYF